MNDLFNQPHFDGSDYKPELDHKRLTGQLKAIYEFMKDGKFRTLSEISHRLNYPECSVSAQIRNLKKARFGGHTIEKQRRGERTQGLFEYKLLIK